MGNTETIWHHSLCSHRWKHRRFVSIGVFQRQREIFPSQVHCSFCSIPMETLIDTNCLCIPEVMGTIALPSALFTMLHIDGHKASVYSTGEGNCSPSP